MAESNSREPVRYIYCHRRGLDEKRRIQIPSKWYRRGEDRKIEPVQFALILWPHGDRLDMYIQVLPPEVFAKLWDKLTSLPLAHPQGQALRRSISERMVLVHLDGAGRIMIPEDMARTAGLTPGEEVVLAGMLNYFQIWSNQRHVDTKSAIDAVMPEAVQAVLGVFDAATGEKAL
jgi:division/cell wall cluster transcriptional repressor MraZ